LEGLSGFSSLPDEATRIPGAVTSACFRARFHLSDPDAVRWLVLRVDYVSGFVAFLNGREVARRGVQGDPPAPDAVATPHARYATEELNFSEDRDVLVAGTNVLAIQLHGATMPPVDLVLVAELCANFQRGPFIQNVTTQGCWLLWKTPLPATSVVEYGVTPALGQSVSDTTTTTNHAVSISGLAPDTQWFYRVRGVAGGEEAVSELYAFRTLRTTGEISFAVFGDSGSGMRPQYEVASCLATAAVDVVLHTGDLAYPNLNRGLVDTRCLSVYAPRMRGTPFFLTPGNHDLYAPDTFATYLETFQMPTNSARGTPHFYSFDHGDAHFVSLFVPTLANFVGNADYTLGPGSIQLQWLTNNLAATTKPWRIVFMHSPLFTSSLHRWNDYNANGMLDRLELQQWLLPVLSQYGVQVVFSGHDHWYERFAPVNGLHCFVTGGGGYALYGLTERDALSQYSDSRYHHLRASIAGDAMQLQAVDRFGVVFDEVVIPRVSLPQLRPSLKAARTLLLEWNAAPGYRYQLETASSPSGPFTPLDSPALPITATNYQAAFEVDLGVSVEKAVPQFFRVHVLPPP
jgi:3',5'-cyclic AMP phosphodiesterase CpdA